MLDGDAEAQAAALEALRGSVSQLAFQEAACRVVQRALQVCSEEDALDMAFELQGQVVKACECAHANHVLQRFLERLPLEDISFVVDEIRGSAVALARHQFAWRIVAKLIKHRENAVVGAAVEEILCELVEGIPRLVNHINGCRVVQALVECGSAQDIHEVAVALHGKAVLYGCSRHAHHVILLLVALTTGTDRQQLISELFASAATLVELGENQFGWLVCRAYLQLPDAQPELLTRFLPEAQPKLAKSKHGRRVLEKLSK